MTFPARDLLNNWDTQQSAYIAHREARFEAVLDVLALTLGDEFHVVDLGCGPGSFSMRLLNRFSQARVTAIDLDPLLLELARHALAEHHDRIDFMRGDIASADCFCALKDRPQAVVSSTAIHWLMPEQQTTLYRHIAELLAEGGIFLNADHQRFDGRNPRQKTLAENHDLYTQELAWKGGAQDWDSWFDDALQYPALQQWRVEREQLFSQRPTPLPTTVDFQLALLQQAGFAETGTVWQFLDDYVVAGWK
ncbi:class I SAM-dependent methyltransferase [Biostraticola tofi]|uniref:Methyltransferase family protein n=1 Tax=Biostraticola tofi TaxID=466109 RepID=A0A4R3YY51_9GAMM|nr:class I SAM-dependent methyltransferase [Biostraticola tofi]TCV96798.1 methyltransferase family protein [Biostraticola tofi]